MRSHESAVASIGAQRHGIVRHDQLAAAGVPKHAAQYLRTRGLLVPVGRGVDRLRDHPFDRRSQYRAALDLAGPGAVLALRTAARVHGFYRYRREGIVTVMARRGREHQLPLGRLVQTGWLPDGHTTEVDGFPVTTVARTFFDLAGHPDGWMRVGHPAHEKQMVAVYDDALGRRGLSLHNEVAVLVVMAKRGRAGTVLVRTLLERFGQDYVPTASDTEALFVTLLDTYGIRPPERQVILSDEQGFIGRVDFCWRDAKHVVEVDSSWHDGPLAKAVDAERDRRLEALGYTVRRYRYGDLVRHPARVAAELGMVGSTISI